MKKLYLFNENIELTNNSKIIREIEIRTKSHSFITNNGNKIIVNEDFFSKKLEVPNVYRYTVLKNSENECQLLPVERHADFKDSKFNDRPISDKCIGTDAIVIIVESPHKDEYNYETNRAIAKAQGSTGRLIEKHLLSKIITKNLHLFNLNSDAYTVLIINPIPFQTSLHFLHKQKLSGKNDYAQLRNTVWEKLWVNEVTYSDNLNTTLININPSLILNCCTKDLKHFVNESISKLANLKFQLGHPSSWFINANKIIATEIS